MKTKRTSAALFALSLAVGMTGQISASLAEGDADAGQRVYNRCRTCHTLVEGQNRVGPTLYGIFGRPAAALEGFRYSQPMRDSGIVWDDTTIDAYVASPRTVVPGGTMAFPGLPNPQQREDLLAYMHRELDPAE